MISEWPLGHNHVREKEGDAALKMTSAMSESVSCVSCRSSEQLPQSSVVTQAQPDTI